MAGMCGGLGEPKEVDEEIKKMCEGLQGEIEEKAGKKFDKYEPLSYSSQVVAGTNYFVKIAVGEEHIHVRIFKPLPHTNEKPSVSNFQMGKKLEDPIVYF